MLILHFLYHCNNSLKCFQHGEKGARYQTLIAAHRKLRLSITHRHLLVTKLIDFRLFIGLLVDLCDPKLPPMCFMPNKNRSNVR